MAFAARGVCVQAVRACALQAKIIRAMQRCGANVLMCGDGGNDVGALKQADVGLALLSGYGNMNTTESVDAAPGGGDAGAWRKGNMCCWYCCTASRYSDCTLQCRTRTHARAHTNKQLPPLGLDSIPHPLPAPPHLVL